MFARDRALSYMAAAWQLGEMAHPYPSSPQTRGPICCGRKPTQPPLSAFDVRVMGPRLRGDDQGRCTDLKTFHLSRARTREVLHLSFSFRGGTGFGGHDERLHILHLSAANTREVPLLGFSFRAAAGSADGADRLHILHLSAPIAA